MRLSLDPLRRLFSPPADRRLAAALATGGPLLPPGTLEPAGPGMPPRVALQRADYGDASRTRTWRDEQRNGIRTPWLPVGLHWRFEDMEAVWEQAEIGTMLPLARMVEAMRSEAIIYGLMGARAAFITRPCTYAGDPWLADWLRGKPAVYHEGRTVEAEIPGRFRLMAPRGALLDLLWTGGLSGMAVAEMVDDPKLGLPVMQTRDLHRVRYDLGSRVWKYLGETEEWEIDPGNGRWILFMPHAAHRPWRSGAWLPLALAFIVMQTATYDAGRFQATNADPLKYVGVDQNVPPEEVDKLHQFVQMWWERNPRIVLPYGAKAGIVESNGQGYQIYDRQRIWAKQQINFTLRGSTATSGDSEGIFNDPEEAYEVAEQIVQTGADALAECLTEQLIAPTLKRFGLIARRQESCSLAWDTRSAKRKVAEASAVGQVCDVITKLDALGAPRGKRVDIDAFLLQSGQTVPWEDAPQQAQQDQGGEPVDGEFVEDEPQGGGPPMLREAPGPLLLPAGPTVDTVVDETRPDGSLAARRREARVRKRKRATKDTDDLAGVAERLTAAGWDESKHKRGKGGQFGEGGEDAKDHAEPGKAKQEVRAAVKAGMSPAAPLAALKSSAVRAASDHEEAYQKVIGARERVTAAEAKLDEAHRKLDEAEDSGDDAQRDKAEKSLDDALDERESAQEDADEDGDLHREMSELREVRLKAEADHEEARDFAATLTAKDARAEADAAGRSAEHAERAVQGARAAAGSARAEADESGDDGDGARAAALESIRDLNQERYDDARARMVRAEGRAEDLEELGATPTQKAATDQATRHRAEADAIKGQSKAADADERASEAKHSSALIAYERIAVAVKSAERQNKYLDDAQRDPSILGREFNIGGDSPKNVRYARVRDMVRTPDDTLAPLRQRRDEADQRREEAVRALHESQGRAEELRTSLADASYRARRSAWRAAAIARAQQASASEVAGRLVESEPDDIATAEAELDKALDELDALGPEGEEESNEVAAKWDESKIKRAKDGKFGEGGGSSDAPKDKPKPKGTKDSLGTGKDAKQAGSGWIQPVSRGSGHYQQARVDSKAAQAATAKAKTPAEHVEAAKLNAAAAARHRAAAKASRKPEYREAHLKVAEAHEKLMKMHARSSKAKPSAPAPRPSPPKPKPQPQRRAEPAPPAPRETPRPAPAPAAEHTPAGPVHVDVSAAMSKPSTLGMTDDAAGDRINAVARELTDAGHGWGDQKAYIVDVAKAMGKTTEEIAPDLVRLNQKGLIDLSSADLIEEMPDKIHDSRISVGGGHGGQVYGFIRRRERARPKPAA